MTRNTNSSHARPGLSPGAGALGVRLRDMFDSVASGPMPDHLVDLVDQLERAYVARRQDGAPAETLAAKPS